MIMVPGTLAWLKFPKTLLNARWIRKTISIDRGGGTHPAPAAQVAPWPWLRGSGLSVQLWVLGPDLEEGEAPDGGATCEEGQVGPAGAWQTDGGTVAKCGKHLLVLFIFFSFFNTADNGYWLVLQESGALCRGKRTYAVRPHFKKK